MRLDASNSKKKKNNRTEAVCDILLKANGDFTQVVGYYFV